MFKFWGNSEQKYAGQDSVLDANFPLPGSRLKVGVGCTLNAWPSKQAKTWKKKPPATNNVITE